MVVPKQSKSIFKHLNYRKEQRFIHLFIPPITKKRERRYTSSFTFLAICLLLNDERVPLSVLPNGLISKHDNLLTFSSMNLLKFALLAKMEEVLG